MRQRNAGMHQETAAEIPSCQYSRAALVLSIGHIASGGKDQFVHPVAGVRIQTPQANMRRTRIGTRMRHDQVQQGLTPVFGSKLPGGEIAFPVGRHQPEIGPAADQASPPFEPLDLRTHFAALCFCQPVQVQFISKGAGHGDNGAGLQRGHTPGLVIRAGGNMGSHSRHRVTIRGAVLDRQPFNGVGIIAAPDLREIRKHPGVKPAAAACAAFKQDLRELLRQPLQKRIHPQHIAVRHLALALRRQRTAVHVAHVAVHIPFDIVDGMLLKQSRHTTRQILHNFRTGQIQHQLVAAHGRVAAGQRQRPVRVGAVQVGIHAHHFRLHPDPEFHAQGVDAPDQRVQPARQFPGVDLPVAKAAVVIVALAEPAVIQDHQFNAQARRLLGDAHDLLCVKVEVSCLPVVDQYRAACKTPGPAADIVTQEAVIDLGKPAQPLIAVCKDDLRGGKLLAGLQKPAEAIVMDAGDQADQAVLGQFHIGAETAGIDRHHAAAGAGFLRGLPVAEDHKRIVVMAGRTPGGGNRLDGICQVHALYLAFHGMTAVEVDQIPLPEGQVQAGRGHLVQLQRAIAVICQPDRTGNDILLCKHAVQEFQAQPCNRVLQAHGQRFGLIVFVVGGGQAVQCIFAGGYLVRNIKEVRAAHPGGIGDGNRAEAEVPHIAAGILLRQDVRRRQPVKAMGVIIGRETHIRRRVQGGKISLPDPAAIIQVQQMPPAVDLHTVACVVCFQPKDPTRVLKDNAHGSSLGPPLPAAGGRFSWYGIKNSKAGGQFPARLAVDIWNDRDGRFDHLPPVMAMP